jgi:hypothetical protein
MELSEAQRSERDTLLRALRENDWVMAFAAKAIGIDKSTALRRVKRYGLDATVEAHNSYIRARRGYAALPVAPRETSRQATEQAENRTAGLCKCGRPPVPLAGGKPGKSCELCRARWRRAKG